MPATLNAINFVIFVDIDYLKLKFKTKEWIFFVQCTQCAWHFILNIIYDDDDVRRLLQKITLT